MIVTSDWFAELLDLSARRLREEVYLAFGMAKVI